MKRTIILWSALFLAATAQCVPLSVVNVSAPEINYLFSSTGTVTVTDSIGTNALTGGGTGVAVLQTRTFVGAPGSPAAGLYAYLYRIDLTDRFVTYDAAHAFGICVHSFALNFGPAVSTLDLNGDGVSGDQVFVITNGGLGTVGPISAVLSNGIVTLQFQPFCTGFEYPGYPNQPGESSFLVGLVSAYPPVPTTAEVYTPPTIHSWFMDARAPSYATLSGSLPRFIRQLPPQSIAAPTSPSKRGIQKAMLNRLAAASALYEAGEIASAINVLRSLQAKVDGGRNDWVINIPATPANEPLQIYSALQALIDTFTALLPESMAQSSRPRQR